MTDISINSKGLTESLTEREQEIIVCLVEGLTNREIATRLHLAYRTVKWYNTQIYSKLGVNNRNDAVIRAHELGLSTPANQPAVTTTTRHNLPHQTTPFIGRQQELGDLARLMANSDAQLITILAPGGMGKTRLGLAAAEQELHHFADGVYFVPLAPLSSTSDIVTTIAENIGFVFHGEDKASQQLVNFLKQRSMLLILDNFEHLLEGATMITDIIQTAPHVKILVTSRERLNVHSEYVYYLSGLIFPTLETLDDTLEYDAIKLFTQSAKRTRSDYELRPEDFDFLLQICNLTAGMPLGIELSAGWIDVLSLEQIAGKLQQGIDILETEMRDIPRRHQSLRATFELTWVRLTEDEQQIFMKLSIFRGGFTLEAAQSVVGATALQLRKLVQKALIQTNENERYAIHELLRQFGKGKLDETDGFPIIQAKHAQYFANFMADRKQDLKTCRQLDALKLVDPDFDNVRAAWLYIVDQHQWEQLPEFLYSIWFYCDIRSRSQDAIQFFEYGMQVLQSTGKSSEISLARGRIMAWMGWFYNDLGFQKKGIDTSSEAIQILLEYSSLEDLIIAYLGLAVFISFSGDIDHAQQMSHESYKLAKKLQDRYWQARSLDLIAAFKVLKGEDDGLAILGQSKLLHESLGNILELEFGIGLEALILVQSKNFSQAKDKLLLAINNLMPFNSAYHIADRLVFLGTIAIFQDDHQQANRYLFQSLRMFWDAGYSHFALSPMLQIAYLMSYTNRLDKVVEIMSMLSEYPTMYYQNFGLHDIYEPLMKELQSKLTAEQFAIAWQRGQEIELSTLIIELLSEFEDI